MGIHKNFKEESNRIQIAFEQACNVLNDKHKSSLIRENRTQIRII